jgi:hypothetical protein
MMITVRYEDSTVYDHVVCIPPIPSMLIDGDSTAALSNMVRPDEHIPEDLVTERVCTKRVREHVEQLVKQ